MSRAWGNLTNFCERNNLSCIDLNTMNSNTFTFIFYNNSYSKWMDHIVGRNTNDVGNINLETTDCTASMCNIIHIKTENGDRYFIPWYKLTINDFSDTYWEINGNINNIMSYEATKYYIIGCQNDNHLAQVDEIFNLLLMSYIHLVNLPKKSS